MCRKHTLDSSREKVHGQQAFETAFEMLTRAEQWAAQVDLFQFGQEQGVIQMNLADVEVAGMLPAPVSVFLEFLGTGRSVNET